MGVHSGPVNEIIDLNGRINVAGAGINMAQRVMDSGDAGHILLSKRVAEDLAQYTRWQPLLHDLEEVEVKHAVRVHLFNLYTGEVGNPVMPEVVKRRKKRAIAPLIIAAGLIAVLLPVALYFLLRGHESQRPQRPESDFRTLMQKKRNEWTNTVFMAQASDGGIKMAVSSAETTTQVWQTAQCLVAALSSGEPLDAYLPKIKNEFRYLENLHRPPPAEGWNLYGDANKFTITEIGSWVVMANLKSLVTKTRIWNDAERTEVINHLVRDLDETVRRQDSSGGWRPIADQGGDFTRTYSTIMAVWTLVEARKTPGVSEKIGSKYDENIRSGINWLLRSYIDKQGWVPNPNRVGQRDRFDGLTAHTLFVLSRAETLDSFAYIKNESVYRAAITDFLNNSQFADWKIDANNSHMPDADLRFVGTEFLAEGSTFLWFPWTLAELSQLASDQSLSPEDRAKAADLRLKIFNNNADRLDTYVETANLMYLLGENLFGVSIYLNQR